MAGGTMCYTEDVSVDKVKQELNSFMVAAYKDWGTVQIELST
jgi:hypothetical protein